MPEKPKPLPTPNVKETEAPAPVISLEAIQKALDGATDDQKAAFAQAVGLSKVIGAPKLRRKRVTDEEVRNMALATGGATHPEDWTPEPPEYVTELGEEAVLAWKQQWLDGGTKNWDKANDQEIAEMVATARM